jgi:hypothetical protein
MNRQHRSWRNLSAQFKAACKAIDAACALCGRPIDYDLSGRDEWGFTSDHIEVLAHGGALLPGFEGLRPAHLKCNSARGAGRNVDQSAWGW